jgi:PAS domain S-box-containing protein
MDTFCLNAFLSALSLLLAIIAALLAVRISELKKRLDTIEKNNLDDRERFRTFFDGVNDAVIIHEPDGRIVGINRKAADMFGIPHEKTDNLSVIKDIFNIDMTDERIRRIWSQVMEGEVAVLPWMLKMPCSGDTFEVELTLRKMLFPDNGIMIISTVRDMTRSNMAESEIRRLAAVVEQVDESVMICDRSSRIIYVNPFFERITGYQALEVLGEKTGILKSGAHDSDFYKGIWEIITAGKNWHGILRNRKKDGTLFDEEATIFPIKNQKSEIARYAAVKRDITQKLKDELALKNAKENAEKLNIELESVIAAANAMSEKAIEASRAKSEFIASVSHELRTPLNIILGSIELMADTQPDAEQDKYLTVCRNACESLLDIISGILDISKIEAGQLHIENIPFDLRSIIEDIILLNSFRAESKGIKLVTEISDDIPSLITGDPARIR